MLNESQSPFTLPCLSYFFSPLCGSQNLPPSVVSRSLQQVADSGGHDDDLALTFALQPSFSAPEGILRIVRTTTAICEMFTICQALK